MIFKFTKWLTVTLSCKTCFYKFGKNLLWLSIEHNKQWNRYSLDIMRKFSYTKDGETNNNFFSTYLNLTTEKAFVDLLQLAYQLAQKLKNTKVWKFIIHFV